MTNRAPLVIGSDGLPQQLQPGDVLVDKVFIQDAAPTPTPVGPYVWWQTNVSGALTLWVEDGH